MRHKNSFLLFIKVQCVGLEKNKILLNFRQLGAISRYRLKLRSLSCLAECNSQIFLLSALLIALDELVL